MLFEDIIGTPSFGTRESSLIKAECSQFLKESAGLPLLKPLPSTYLPFQKVKVRQQKRNDVVGEIFNEAFREKFTNLRQRAVFTYTQPPLVESQQELFYVFPINGYHFLYSKEVTNSSHDYRRVVDTLFEHFGDSLKASEVVTDMLKYTYSSTNLREGIESHAEVILYGIPYYYAVKATAVNGYTSLFDV